MSNRFFGRLWRWRQVVIVVLTALNVFVSTVACNRSEVPSASPGTSTGKSIRQRFGPSGSPLRAAERIILPSDAGPHVRFVAQFFEHWKARQYAAMRSQLADIDPSADFAESLAATPVSWDSVRLAPLPAKADDQQVSVTIEVTDIASVVVAYHFSRAENSPYSRTYSRTTPFPATPSALGIETFQAVTEIWIVERINGETRIRRGANQATDVLGYALDAGGRTFEPLGGSQEQSLLHLALVLERLSRRLGMERGQFENLYSVVHDKSVAAAELIPGVKLGTPLGK